MASTVKVTGAGGRGVKVRVYDSQIQALFLRGEKLSLDGQDLQRLIITRATTIALNRFQKASGSTKSEHLARSHRGAGWIHAGPYRGQIMVENTASYAWYVHQGHGPSFGRPYLAIPRVDLPYFQGTRGKVYLKMVRGQRPSPWLEKAAEGALRRYGAKI